MKEIPIRTIAADAVADYKRKASLVEARETVHCLAVEHGHALGIWRVHDDDRVALVQCKACGEGARLDLATAEARITDGLRERCPGLPKRYV